MLDPILVDTGVSGGNNPHGDASRGDITQAISDIERDDDDSQDWGTTVLNHMLVNVLDKDWVEASATNDFTVFVIANDMDDLPQIADD